MSVLESLRVNLEQFTLASVLTEVTAWMKAGVGLVTNQWREFTRETSTATLNAR